MKNLFQKIIVTACLAFALFGTSSALAVEVPFSPDEAGTVEVDLHQIDENDNTAEDFRESPEDQAGVIQIRAILLNVYYFLKYGIIALAVVFLSVTGIRLVTAGHSVDEEVSQGKENIKWVAYGLITFLMIDVFINTFFGQGSQSGTIFHDTTDSQVLYETASYLTREIFHLLDFILSFASLVGVLVIILSAITIVGSFGNESTISKQRKISMIVVGGLAIIALAKTVVGRVIFGIAGYDEIGDIVTTNGSIISREEVGFLVNAEAGTDEIIGIANYALGFVGLLALIMFVYGAARMVAARGDEGEIGKAKGVMVSAVIGVVIAVCSYTIVATFINPS